MRVWVHVGSAAWEAHGVGRAWAKLACHGPLMRTMEYRWVAEPWWYDLLLAKAAVAFAAPGLCFA